MRALGLRVVRRNVYSSTRNRRSASTETVWSGIRTVFIPKSPTLVSGVRDDGFREILAVEVADTESEATYQELFRTLKRRGLKGVELVVSDETTRASNRLSLDTSRELPTRDAKSTTQETSSAW